MMDVFDYPLPDWAIAYNKGHEVRSGAQLCTKDGRRMGNAFVYLRHSYGGKEGTYKAWIVVTDMGNVMTLTEEEIHELFYIGDYIMDAGESWDKRVWSN